jgi:hypothetical protein
VAPVSRAAGSPGFAEQVLTLQRSAGNAAVTRMLRPRRALSRFSDPAIEAVAQAHPEGVRTSDGGTGLDLLDRAHGTIGSAWSHLDWETVAAEAAARIYQPSLINQGPTGLCGLAAILNFMADAEPGTFAHMVETIFEDGGISSSHRCNRTLRDNTPMPGMAQVDWMMLSAMQDLSNDVLEYHGRPDPSTFWSLRREGTTVADDPWVMHAFTRITDTDNVTCEYWGVREATDRASELLRRYGDRICMIVSVNSATLQGENNHSGHTDHAIRLLEPVRWEGGRVRFKVFSWGRVWDMTFAERNFEFMVGAYDWGIAPR